VTSDAQLVIRGVTVVDPRDGSLRAGQDVRIAGERIVSVEPADDGQPAPAALCDDPAFRREPGLRYVAPSVLQGWSKAAKKFSGFPASARQTFRAVYGVLLNLTKVLDEAGVPMLAGSDSGGAAWDIPGLALHQEFDELARAGLSPLRVLQMTTWNAAEFMNATDVMGSVAAGKHADLVLLDANPVESVDHLHRICGVVRGGRYLGPADLDALKEKVAATRSVR
jgi:hypothetical protein